MLQYETQWFTPHGYRVLQAATLLEDRNLEVILAEQPSTYRGSPPTYVCWFKASVEGKESYWGGKYSVEERRAEQHFTERLGSCN